MKKSEFKKLILNNRINMKEFKNLNALDFFKMYLLKRPYIHVALKQLEPMLIGLSESVKIRFVDFCHNTGYIGEYDGDMVKFFTGFVAFVVTTYYPVVGDSKSVADNKINILWEVFNKLKIKAEFSVKDKGMSYITAIINELIEQANNKIL